MSIKKYHENSPRVLKRHCSTQLACVTKVLDENRKNTILKPTCNLPVKKSDFKI